MEEMRRKLSWKEVVLATGTGNQIDGESMKRGVMVIAGWMKTGFNVDHDACPVESRLTCSFHSTTHFSIHGRRLMTTNSRVNRAVCWMSFSDILREGRRSGDGRSSVGEFGADEPESVGRGRRGTRAGTGTGGGGGTGIFKASR